MNLPGIKSEGHGYVRNEAIGRFNRAAEAVREAVEVAGTAVVEVVGTVAAGVVGTAAVEIAGKAAVAAWAA